MANKSTLQANRELNWLKGTNHPAALSTIYLALFTTAPGPGSEGAEVTGGGYARKAITTSTGFTAITGSPPATPRSISNAGDLAYAVATTDWGTVVGWKLMDAATGGGNLAFGLLKDAQAVPTGQQFKVQSGNLVISAA